MKTNLMQLLRLVLMVLAVAGVIYAIEFMERGIAVWFWVALLGIGFVGLLYTFRLTQRRVARENRERQRLEKKRSRRGLSHPPPPSLPRPPQMLAGRPAHVQF